MFLNFIHLYISPKKERVFCSLDVYLQIIYIYQVNSWPIPGRCQTERIWWNPAAT